MTQTPPTTFSGTASTYTVVAADPHLPATQWGVSVLLKDTQAFVLRIATCGLTKSSPKHFNFRMQGEFLPKGEEEPVVGLYFDRMIFWVVPKPVPAQRFNEICDLMDIPAIMGEWLVVQFAQEGVSIDPALALKLFTDALPKEEAVLPCFKIPKPIWHEPKTTDAPKAGSQPSA